MGSAKAEKEELNPKTQETEFGGVLGALAISIGLPALTLGMHFMCNENYCPKTLAEQVRSFYMLRVQISQTSLRDIFLDADAWKFYLSWFGVLVLLERILPGKQLLGVPLRNGERLSYKLNGKALVGVLTAVLIARFFATDGAMPELVFIYNHILSLTGTSIAFSFILSTWCYINSFLPNLNGQPKVLALGGNTGNFIFDWFIGRDLNPRIGTFDVKLFCEVRPGLLLWSLINLSMAHHQWKRLGYIEDSMWVILILQIFYSIDGVFNEEGILSMIDVTTDGFGFMLCFGDLALVPFTYTLQTRYLANIAEPIHLGYTKCALIFLLKIVGYLIFHFSNAQKAKFKSGDPSASKMKYIAGENGSMLLVSGWWGMARHINYLGDILMALSWCLPTGFNTPFTYYYVFYFIGLLVHREGRDDAKCKKKYGKLWERYCAEVPYRICPYIY